LGMKKNGCIGKVRKRRDKERTDKIFEATCARSATEKKKNVNAEKEQRSRNKCERPKQRTWVGRKNERRETRGMKRTGDEKNCTATEKENLGVHVGRKRRREKQSVKKRKKRTPMENEKNRSGKGS